MIMIDDSTHTQVLKNLPIGSVIQWDTIHAINTINCIKVRDEERSMVVRTDSGEIYWVLYANITHQAISIAEKLLGTEIIQKPMTSLNTANDYVNYIKASHPDIDSISYFVDRSALDLMVKWRHAINVDHMNELYKILREYTAVSLNLILNSSL